MKRETDGRMACVAKVTHPEIKYALQTRQSLGTTPCLAPGPFDVEVATRAPPSEATENAYCKIALST